MPSFPSLKALHLPGTLFEKHEQHSVLHIGRPRVLPVPNSSSADDNSTSVSSSISSSPILPIPNSQFRSLFTQPPTSSTVQEREISASEKLIHASANICGALETVSWVRAENQESVEYDVVSSITQTDIKVQPSTRAPSASTSEYKSYLFCDSQDFFNNNDDDNYTSTPLTTFTTLSSYLSSFLSYASTSFSTPPAVAGPTQPEFLGLPPTAAAHLLLPLAHLFQRRAPMYHHSQQHTGPKPTPTALEHKLIDDPFMVMVGLYLVLYGAFAGGIALLCCQLLMHGATQGEALLRRSIASS